MKIYLIGIGGIGVSALAQYYLAKGHQVSGSDLNASEITNLLEQKGAKISIGPHNEGQDRVRTCPDPVNLVVYSPAVKNDNPELRAAREQGIKCQSYPEALGEITKQYFTIAVSGTHGKSTTSAMLALILIKAGLDPTVIIGTKLKEFVDNRFRAIARNLLSTEGSNFRLGSKNKIDDKDYLIIEADEWQASFLNYWPKIIVLTNIEKEHLDYYKDLEHILETYREYIGHLPEDGTLITNKDDENIKRISNFQSASWRTNSKDVAKLQKILQVPGEHNIKNALAALSTARILGIEDKIAFEALGQFRGSWRRFEEKKLEIGNWKLEIISDYAHHPTEIAATLQAAREKYPNKKIWCVFQPHQYQRTYFLFNDFVKVFQQALTKRTLNKLIITDIYDVAGRENKEIKQKVSSKKLIKAIYQCSDVGRQNIDKACYLPKNQIIKYLKRNLKGREVIIIMGAGNIYKLTYPQPGN